MCIAHIFNTVGNQVPRWQRVEHSVMSHGNSIVYCNGIEFCSITSFFFNNSLNSLADIMKMRVTRDKLSKRINHSNNGLSKLFFPHSGGTPKTAGSGHPAALCGD